MQVQSYLNFDGRCEEAFEFYRSAIGAKLDMLMRFKETPEPITDDKMPKSAGEKIMHMSFHIGETMLMASDCYCGGKPTFQGFSLSLAAADEAEAERLFKALSDGGQVQMPLAKTFFSPKFGMLTDRFGVSWMVLVAQHNQ